MPTNRKRRKRVHSGGYPEWFITYLKTGKKPLKDTPEDREYWHWHLFAGEHIHGIKPEDCYYAKDRRKILKSLDL